MSGNYPADVGKGSMSRKPKRSERSPDFNGTVKIEGKEYWISGWEREGNDGEYISLAFQPKLARQWAGGTGNPPHPTADQVKPGARPEPKPEPEFDDDIPF